MNSMIEAWIRVYIPFALIDRVRVWCVLRDVSLNFILNYFVLLLQNHGRNMSNVLCADMCSAHFDRMRPKLMGLMGVHTGASQNSGSQSFP